MKHLEDLQKCTVQGNTVKLPTEILPNYKDVRKALINAGGTYKQNTFIFQTDAGPIMERLINGTNINRRQETQYFPTPVEIAEYMADQILVQTGPIKALEPSAGDGRLIEALLKVRPEAEITAIELDPILFKQLNEKQFNAKIEAIQGDFMDFPGYEAFDLVFANPPFTRGTDVDHIMKMWDHVKPGGQLITLSSPSFETNTNKKFQEFKALVEMYGHWVKLPGASFASAGTKIDVFIHILNK